ncbi:DUF3347 domain-containing protein [Balneolaceae bacterium ANBcel3]|nr:DUF3347 domain-containing protein [Balneolaceae bacterium ANBcel3]
MVIAMGAKADNPAEERVARIIEEYMNVKDALVHDNDEIAAAWAERLETSIATIPPDSFDEEINPDVEGLQAVMMDAAGNIVDAENKEEQREALANISRDLLEFIELTGNPGEPIYVFACPLFMDGEAIWLGHAMQVANPYQGPSNINAGELIQEL